MFNPTNVPAGLSNVVAIAGGTLHNLAIKNDGTVVAWGDNGAGQTNVPAGLTNVVAIAAGSYHSLALKNDGTVVAWGFDSAGQTNVPAGLTNVVAVAAGGFHSLALKNDGSVVAWGDNSAGQKNVPAGFDQFCGHRRRLPSQSGIDTSVRCQFDQRRLEPDQWGAANQQHFGRQHHLVPDQRADQRGFCHQPVCSSRCKGR